MLLSTANIKLDAGASSSATTVTKRPKKSPHVKIDDAVAKDRPEGPSNRTTIPDSTIPRDDDSELDDQGDRKSYDEDEDDVDDPFRAGFFGGGPPGHLSTLRALTGMVSGTSHRLRDLLEKIRQKDSPDIQMVALSELSEILLISTEDNLQGHFSPDQFVKELVELMEKGGITENPDIMLLACRCIANMMEALPSSVANVVYGQAVPVLIKKLADISYIDLAEQALSVSFPLSGDCIKRLMCTDS